MFRGLITHISWILAKHIKPYTDVGIIKEYMLDAGNALFKNQKDFKYSIASFFKHKEYTSFAKGKL